jgi:hypothetical protein
LFPLPLVGNWEFNTEELPGVAGNEAEIRWAIYFSAEHQFESMLWSRDTNEPDTRTAYHGMRTTGTWSARAALPSSPTGPQPELKTAYPGC